MKTISELRLEGDARVSIHDMNRFEAAILGSRGDLDAWLERNNEEEVRLHIGKLLHLCVADLQHENQSLRTKIAEMERKEPVAWLHGAQPAPSVPTSLLVAVADLCAQMEIVSRVGFVDTPNDQDSCAAFCVAEGTWLELMSAIESLASALAAAAPEAKP